MNKILSILSAILLLTACGDYGRNSKGSGDGKNTRESTSQGSPPLVWENDTAQIYNESTGQIVPIEESTTILVEKYIHTWSGTRPNFKNPYSKGLISNIPTFRIVVNKPGKLSKVLAGFSRVKDDGACRDVTTTIPLSPVSDAENQYVVGMSLERLGETIFDQELDRPTPWCAVIETFDSNKKVVSRKEWKLLVTLRYPELNVVHVPVVWRDEDPSLKSGVLVEPLIKERLTRQQLREIFSGNDGAIIPVRQGDPLKVVYRLEIENPHYLPFLLKIPSVGTPKMKYRYRYLVSGLQESDEKPVRRELGATEFGDFRILKTRLVTQKGETLQPIDGSSDLYEIPGRKVDGEPTKVYIESLSDFEASVQPFQFKSNPGKGEGPLDVYELVANHQFNLRYGPSESPFKTAQEKYWASHEEGVERTLIYVRPSLRK